VPQPGGSGAGPAAGGGERGGRAPSLSGPGSGGRRQGARLAGAPRAEGEEGSRVRLRGFSPGSP